MVEALYGASPDHEVLLRRLRSEPGERLDRKGEIHLGDQASGPFQNLTDSLGGRLDPSSRIRRLIHRRRAEQDPPVDRGKDQNALRRLVGSGKEDGVHKAGALLVQQHILPAPGVEARLSQAGHRRNSICKQSGRIDHRVDGIVIPLGQHRTDSAGRRLDPRNLLREMDGNAVLGSILDRRHRKPPRFRDGHARRPERSPNMRAYLRLTVQEPFSGMHLKICRTVLVPPGTQSFQDRRLVLIECENIGAGAQKGNPEFRT